MSPRHRLRAARARLVILVLLLLLFSLFVFGAVLVAASSIQHRKELEGSLQRTALSFRYTRSRQLEQLTREGDLLASDPRLHQYREALRLTGPAFADYRTLRDALRQHMRDAFGTSAGDLLLLVDADGRLQLAVQQETPDPEGETRVEPSEATSEAEAAAGSTEPLPAEGRDLPLPLVEAVFQDGVSRAGYLRLSSKGFLYEAAAVPLKTTSRADGVLLVARRITEASLVDWSQGLPDGVVVLVANGEILAAHDRRAGRRPSPALASSLVTAIAGWNPPQTTGMVEPEKAPIGTLDVGGREWLDLAVELGSGDSRPAGWAIFLGDASGQADRTTRDAWLLAETGLAVLAMALVLTWLLAGWVVSPLAEDDEVAES